MSPLSKPRSLIRGLCYLVLSRICFSVDLPLLAITAEVDLVRRDIVLVHSQGGACGDDSWMSRGDDDGQRAWKDKHAGSHICVSGSVPPHKRAPYL